MKTCSLCAGPLGDDATACPRCGIAAPRGATRSRPSRVRRVLAAASMLSVAAVLALPLARELRAGAGCEPQSWVDWHVAMKRACLTPAYVCENMTAAKMLEDPQLADAYASALRAGQPAGLAQLDALVDHLRAAYGCDGAAAAQGLAPAAPSSPRLPPGHPPVGAGRPHAAPPAPVFQAPDILTI